jgi:subtilisin family serine protease
MTLMLLGAVARGGTIVLPGELPASAQEPELSPVADMVQLDEPEPGPALIEASSLVRVVEARNRYDVDGSGPAVAVLDSGLRTTHVDFDTRVLVRRDFTKEGTGDEDVTDHKGHGTHVAGIVAANKDHVGMARRQHHPLGAFPVRRQDLEATDNALQWSSTTGRNTRSLS